MKFVSVEQAASTARVVLCRGKVNALNPDVVAELRGALAGLRDDPDVRSIILTGRGPFFSFGFDVPELISYSRETFTEYALAFTTLYNEIYICPRPVIAAINGHAVAGGCMIAIAADHRVMVSGNARIGLNEVTFGASIFAGAAEILSRLTGSRFAERIALAGALYTAEQALALGLVDEVCGSGELDAAVTRAAESFAGADPVAFASIKRLMRGPVAARIRAAEVASIREFVDIWYSPSTRKQLERITIRS